MSESSEQARVEWEPLSVREARRKIAEWEARDKPAQTRATATDEQRARVADHIADLHLLGRDRNAAAFAAVLADSEALAARNAPHLTLGHAVDALIAVINSGSYPAEDARLVVNELTRWQQAKYPARDPAPTHEREEK